VVVDKGKPEEVGPVEGYWWIDFIRAVYRRGEREARVGFV